jgi:hypothetical protein
MTLDRFRDLAEAYGATVARWPEDQRDAALRIASQPDAVAILAQAAALDTMLDGWTIPVPANSLPHRIAAQAPTPGRSPAARARLWWSGIGIAAALAGVVSGTAAVAIVTPVDASPDSGTSFGTIDPQDG